MIGFFHENEEYGCFSNWYPAEFQYAGKTFTNSEQFMMFHKVSMFHRHDLAEQIMNTVDPAKCKKIAGQRFPEYNDYIWNRTCRTIVKRGVYAKFQQNQDILQILLSTGNALLAECSPYDRKWGIGIDISDPARFDILKWQGDNYLGVILMQVREELALECQAARGNRLTYINARDLAPIKEWQMSAGELKRIPQYYHAIHAYSDTLRSDMERDAFYRASLDAVETSMRINMGGGLPLIGFYEMKQEIYDISRRLTGFDSVKKQRLDFCRKYIPILKMIDRDEDMKHMCRSFSAFTSAEKTSSLVQYLYDAFMPDAYSAGMVITNYMQLVEDEDIKRWVANPSEEQLSGLDEEHVLACIAWHFRCDHFSNGSLINNSVSNGHMLRMLETYEEKVRV